MVSISYSLPGTGYASPSKDEAEKLMRVTDAAHPSLGLLASTDVAEFRRAFTASGLMFRRSEPDTQHAFSFYVDAANEMLSTRWGAPGVSGNALLSAVLAHGDVCWRKADRAVGQLLEVGLDLYHGGMCQNRWRDIIEGRANLLSPLPPRAAFVERNPRQTTSFWKQGTNGLQQIIANERLWDR